MITTHDYYRDPQVIRRMLEFCGVSNGESKNFSTESGPLITSHRLREQTRRFSCEYLVGYGGRLLNERGEDHESVYNYSLGWILDNDLDIFRSIWDKKSTLGVIDIEYYSKKYPGEVYMNQEDVFWKMEPFYQCLKDVFMGYGIKPLTVATGQGYHFTFRIDHNSQAHKQLGDLANVEGTLKKKYMHVQMATKHRRPVTTKEGRGFEAMSRMIEFIVHKAMVEAPRYNNPLSLSIGDVFAGNEKKDCLNIDLSMYTSPLHMRSIRIPFSSHQKHKVSVWKSGEEVARKIPIQISIPRYTPCNNNELLLHELFKNRRHFENSANYAAAISTEIPEASFGLEKVIADYRKSKLYEFHKDFDMNDHDPPWNWGATYDRFDISQLSPCVATHLHNPAPALLEPVNIQALVRTLTGKGWWHPKHVAGLIRSKYERDYGWMKEDGGDFNFYKYDAMAMANKWVRFYAGLIACGIDQKTDLNCVSQQDKGICITPDCGYNLENYR